MWVPSGRGPEGMEGEGLCVSPNPPEWLLDRVREGYTFVAHNAIGFDAEAYRLLVGGPQPEWFDTLPCARAAGLPGGLDALARIFTGRGKEDSRAMHLLTKAKVRNGEVQYPVGTLELWRYFLLYNVADVVLLRDVYAHVSDYGEADVLAADRAINDRGIAVDLRFAKALAALWEGNETSAADDVRRLSGGALHVGNIRSVPQVKKWVESQGIKLSSLNRTQLELFYADPEAWLGEEVDNEAVQLVVAVLKARQAAVRTSGAKVGRIAEMADPDGRVRETVVYHGAHTGRWAGRGVQPHNFPRGLDGRAFDLEAVLRRYEVTGALTLEDVKNAMPR